MRGFINPYNFVSFPKKKARAYTDSDVHTGVIEYTITTKTPLFIPNSSSDQAFSESDRTPDHKSYDFFSYEELDSKKRYENIYHEPVIPGSEIRGVVRTVYETLTDSCMGMLNTAEYPVKRIAEAFQPALLHRENGKFVLYKADTLRIGNIIKYEKTLKNYSNGTCVYYHLPKDIDDSKIIIQKYSFNKTSGSQNRGYLIKWGTGATKLRYHVFTLNYGENNRVMFDRLCEMTKAIVENKMYPVIESYLSQPGIHNDNRTAYEEYKKDLRDFLENGKDGYFPVCYSKMGQKTNMFYLAPAILSKEVANKNLEAYAGEFAPCKGTYCPACDLFGYVGKDNSSSKGSKIRFSDLYVAEEKSAKDYYDKDKVTIAPLGGPKLGNVDFYLQKPKGARFWNYDYYVKEDGTIVIEQGKLRGRKFYWHHKPSKLVEQEPSNLNKTIRPVKAEVCFKGKMYFDSISQKQLNQLIWILDSGNQNLGLKLGGAKPLGFGSIACSVTKVLERTVTVSNGMVTYDLEEGKRESLSYEKAEFSVEAKAEFVKIAGLDSVLENVEVTYPKTIDQKEKPLTEGYKWFECNHSKKVWKRRDMIIKETLPTIQCEDFSLKYYEVYSTNKPKNTIGHGKYEQKRTKNVKNVNRPKK